MLKFCKYWLLPLLWMALIFSGSSDSHSYQHSSRLIEPLLRWLFPRMAQATMDDIVLFIRKCAHVTEYAILAGLLWRALRRPVKNDARPWSWPVAGLALLIVMLYASSDEIHQLFVPTRTAHVTDVLIDTAGGALGLFLAWLMFHWRRKNVVK